MKQEWHVNPVPPPDEPAERRDGFTSFAIIVFVVLGPLIYFGPQLGAAEAWLMDAYSAIDRWVAPIRQFVLG
jgi:hypothetical protein